MVIEVIMNGFIILYFALYYLFNFLDDYQLIEERETLCDKLFNISIFFKFQNMFFNEFLELYNDLYFALCIYEFFVSFSYEDFRYHDINYEFFSKIKVYDDNKLLDVAKYDQSLFRYKTFLNIKNKY